MLYPLSYGRSCRNRIARRNVGERLPVRGPGTEIRRRRTSHTRVKGARSRRRGPPHDGQMGIAARAPGLERARPIPSDLHSGVPYRQKRVHHAVTGRSPDGKNAMHTTSAR